MGEHDIGGCFFELEDFLFVDDGDQFGETLRSHVEQFRVLELKVLDACSEMSFDHSVGSFSENEVVIERYQSDLEHCS